MNGISKKLCITALSIGMIMQLARDAEDKLSYALVIAGICVIYKVVQGFIDWKK